MNFARVLSRSIHQAHHGLSQDVKRNKTAKEVLKLVNRSHKEPIDNEKDVDNLPEWKKQALALRRKFKGERWSPAKKLSRAEMEGLRLLKSQFPQLTASDLSERYKVSPEVVRRILKSKWQPSEKEMIRINERWKRRGEKIQDLYKTSPELMLNSNRIALSKKISISSARNSDDFVLRGVKDTNNRKPISELNQRKEKGKNKLFLLQRNTQSR